MNRMPTTGQKPLLYSGWNHVDMYVYGAIAMPHDHSIQSYTVYTGVEQLNYKETHLKQND